jgi:hypothetical protein
LIALSTWSGYQVQKKFLILYWLDDLSKMNKTWNYLKLAYSLLFFGSPIQLLFFPKQLSKNFSP